MSLDLPMARADYGIHRRSGRPFEEVDRRVREELQKEGFGILTEIDVRATLKKKLDADFPRYVILGACNPKLAQQALTAQPDIGLLLPCNVVLNETSAGVEVSALKPTTLFGALVEAEGVAKLAREAEERIARALESAVRD